MISNTSFEKLKWELANIQLVNSCYNLLVWISDQCKVQQMAMDYDFASKFLPCGLSAFENIFQLFFILFSFDFELFN